MFEYRSDPFGNIVDFLFGNTYTLLNKNLNFVPTPKQYSHNQHDTDSEKFFRLLCLL